MLIALPLKIKGAEAAPARAVLLPVDYFEDLLNNNEDEELLLLAEQRIKNSDPDDYQSLEDVMKDLGISEEDVDVLLEKEDQRRSDC